MLRMKNPQYLECRVEDRLLEKGQLYKYKQEEYREHAQKQAIKESVPKARSKPKSLTNTAVKNNRTTSKSGIMERQPSSGAFKPINRAEQNVLTSPSNNKLNKSVQSIRSMNRESLNNSITSSIKKNPSLMRNESKEDLNDHLLDIRKHLSNYYTTKTTTDKVVPFTNKSAGKEKQLKQPITTVQNKIGQKQAVNNSKHNSMGRNNIQLNPSSGHAEDYYTFKGKANAPNNLEDPKDSYKDNYNSAKAKVIYDNDLRNYDIVSRQRADFKDYNNDNVSTTPKTKYNFINPGVGSSATNTELHDAKINNKATSNKSQDVIPSSSTNVSYRNKRMEDLNSIINFASNLNTIADDNPIQRNTRPSQTVVHKNKDTYFKKPDIYNPPMMDNRKEITKQERLNDYIDKMADNTYKQNKNINHPTYTHHRDNPCPTEINKDRPRYEYLMDKANIDKPVTCLSDKDMNPNSFKREIKEYPRQYNYSHNDNLNDIKAGSNIQSKKNTNRFEIDHYEDEVNKIRANIDYINEKLKLTDLSKDFVKEKVGEFVTTKNQGIYNKPIGNIFFNF
jgi:hypothetical protein